MSSDLSSRVLEDLGRGVHLLELVGQNLGASAWEDRLDASGLRLEANVEAVPFPQLVELLAVGGRVAISVEVAGWSARFDGAPRGAITLSAKGEAYEAFDGEQLQRARSAIEAGSAEELYGLCAPRSGSYTLWVENDHTRSGFHWYRRRQVLMDDLSGQSALAWISTHLRVDGPRRFVLHDAGAGVLTGPAIVIHGPDTWPENPTFDPWSIDVGLYFDAFLSHRTSAAPPPSLLEVSTVAGLEDIKRELIGWAHVLCWWWVASDVVAGKDSDGRQRTQLRFDGARVVLIDIAQQPRDSASASLEVWRWATTTVDHDRREALQRAVSLAAQGPADLEDPAPIFRSAKWLLDLSRRAAVAEGFATRRAARETTVTSSRAAAEAAATAAGRAFDRILVQVAAAAGILLAQYKSAIDATVAARLMGVAFVLVVVFGSVSYFIEFPAARHQLDAATRDLVVFRETLSSDDVAEFANMTSIAAARRVIRLQRIASLTVSVLAALAFAGVALRLASFRAIVVP